MESRANYALIGAFTLAVLMTCFVFVFWFQRGTGGGETAAYRVIFEGPVSGLRAGAAVLFNGIRVGEVAALTLDPQQPRKVMALIKVSRNAPVRADTAVAVEYQGLTGIAALGLRGGSPNAPALVASDNIPPTLQSDPAATQDVMQTGREVLRRVDEMLVENQASLRAIIKNLESFTAVMVRNSERIDSIVSGTEKVVKGAETLFNGTADKPGEVSATLVAVRRLADNLDTHADQAIRSYKQLADDLNRGAGEAIQSYRQLADNLDKRTGMIADDLQRFSGEGLQKWERLAVDARRAVNTFERAVRNFDRNPSRVIWGSTFDGLTGGANGAQTRAQQRR